MQNLGATIRQLREKHRYSQSALAHLINIPSQSKISAWESDQTIPDVFEAQRIAKVFGISVDEFLGGEGL
jgi:transcriptional regulator with XRE-family HTH domain